MTNEKDKRGRDPSEIIIATATFEDGREEDITGARFFEMLHHVANMEPGEQNPNEPNEKELLEMFAQLLRVMVDFEIDPGQPVPEWYNDGKTRGYLSKILEHVTNILDDFEEWEKRVKAGETQPADDITKFLRGEIEYMLAPRPRGYNELLKINSTGEKGMQYREVTGEIKLSFPGRLAFEEQKIRQACEFAFLKKNHYGAKKNLLTRVTIPIDEIMDVLGRPKNSNNKKQFKRKLERDILPNIKDAHIDAKIQTAKKEGAKDIWIQTNIGQTCGIINDHIYFQFTEDYARYINTGIIKPYHHKLMRLGSRQFPLPYYVAQKMSDQYFYYVNQGRSRKDSDKKGTHDILRIKTLLDHCKEVIDYDYILQTDPTHWKSKIKAKYERALNEIQEAGLFKWEYCGPGLKEIPQRGIKAADFYEWSELYITFQLIPNEPAEQEQRIKNRQERIEKAIERKALEDDRATVEAEKIREQQKRRRKKAAKKDNAG